MGYAQKSTPATPDHRLAIETKLDEMIDTGLYRYATLDRSWRRSLVGALTSFERPDIILVRHDGRVDAFEIMS